MKKEQEEFIIKEFGSIKEYEERVEAINKKCKDMQRVEQMMRHWGLSIEDMLDQDTFNLDNFRLGLMEDNLTTICRLAEIGKTVAKWRKNDSLHKEFQKIEEIAKDVLSTRFYSDVLEEMFRYDSKRNYSKQCKDILKKMRGE